MIRAAQVVAVSAQLGRSDAEIHELLRPYKGLIQNRMHHIAVNTLTGIDMYVDELFSDWASRMSWATMVAHPRLAAEARMKRRDLIVGFAVTLPP